jgi:ornithine carbamoyltransferase
VPITGTQVNANLQVASDAISDYLTNNSATLSGAQQNSILSSLTTIGQKTTAIATMVALDGLDPKGILFPKLTQATQDAKTTLDNLAQTESAVAKAFTIIGDFVNVVTSIASMDVVNFGGAVEQFATDV